MSVEGREGREGSLGSFLTSLLTLFFLVIGVGISGDAVGLGLAGGALGSQQIQRGYCFRLSVTLLVIIEPSIYHNR